MGLESSSVPVSDWLANMAQGSSSSAPHLYKLTAAVFCAPSYYTSSSVLESAQTPSPSIGRGEPLFPSPGRFGRGAGVRAMPPALQFVHKAFFKPFLVRFTLTSPPRYAKLPIGLTRLHCSSVASPTVSFNRAVSSSLGNKLGADAAIPFSKKEGRTGRKTSRGGVGAIKAIRRGNVSHKLCKLRRKR